MLSDSNIRSKVWPRISEEVSWGAVVKERASTTTATLNPVTAPTPTRLPEAEWRAREAVHQERADAFTSGWRERAGTPRVERTISSGVRNPVRWASPLWPKSSADLSAISPATIAPITPEMRCCSAAGCATARSFVSSSGR